MAFGVFQFRRGTAAQWTAANTVLASGELGLETDTSKFKIGNGTAGWNALPYGGIKGDTGATGAAGVSPSVTVGATTVVTPATNPSATDADAGPNADIRFSLPRARNVSAGTTTTGAAGTSASVASAQDANGDVTLNFTIPRGDAGTNGWSPILANVTDGERRVLRLVDWTGGTGTKPAVPTDNYIGPAGFTNLAGATDIRGATGAAGAVQNTFGTIAVAGQNNVVADAANDTLTLVAGTNITLTTNDTTDSVTIAATIAAQNTFANVTVGTTPTPTVLQADTAADTLSINAGTGISLTADAATDSLSIVNAGVTSNVAGTGISVNNATGTSTITNTGVTSAAAGTGIGVSASTGGVTISNTGVTSVAAGTGIGVSAATGGVTISNAGVTSFNGATGAITGVNSVNGQTGAVTVATARARIGPPTIANATTTTETIVAKWILPANFLLAQDSIRALVMHQSAGTGTLIYRCRIGALGTIADGLLATLTTSAAQVANAQGRADFTIYFPNTTTATGSGFAIQQAAALGTVTGAGANVTVVPANVIHLSITVQCSAAAANVTRGAWATVGN